MARVARKTQKIFASSASNNGVFGSAQDNTKILSNDVAVLQSKPAFLTGWLDAIIGSRKFPPLEEFQSLNYINTYQLAYLFQEGIPEYDSGTTYYQHSIVKKTGTYELYGSLTDSNVGNALTDGTNWEFLQDLSLSYQHATTTQYGIVQLAQNSDITAGSSSGNVPTAAQLASNGFVTGDWKGTTATTLQAGWVWGAGEASTIGNASSNATGRANADTQDLFNLYWNASAYNYTGTTANGANGQLQVFDSSGTRVAKGASAAADWAANRAIAVVDFRGLVPAGKDNMNGVAAGRLSGQPGGVNGQILAARGGSETHTMTISELVPHDHPVQDSSQAGSTLGTFFYGEPGNNPDQPANHVSNTGDGDPFNIVQPTVISNIIIKL